MKRPLIFVTNDDGIDSPGIRAAVHAVLPLGEVVVLAPRHQQSSTGRGMYGDRATRLVPGTVLVDGRAITAFSCDASPAQTVLHGLTVLASERAPDLLVSGINYGENLGTNVTLSGTVGAALEAASVGIPALAVSLQTEHVYHAAYGELDWATAEHFARQFAKRLLRERLPADVDVINVVVPETATPATPWRVTRQSRHAYFSVHMPERSVESRIGDARLGVYLEPDAVEPDSDIAAILRDGHVSVTPLSVDCTSRTDMRALDATLRG
jgi:5'-nucleotidase